jgi:hypothetical protein
VKTQKSKFEMDDVDSWISDGLLSLKLNSALDIEDVDSTGNGMSMIFV